MILSQESVDAIAKAVEVMVDLLNDILISLREDLQEIKNNSQLGDSLKKVSASSIEITFGREICF